MFHKRLLQEFKENRKYIAGMVITQWVALLANLVLTGTTVRFLTMPAEGGEITRYLLLLVLVFAVRSVMISLEIRMSYRASTLVKRSLREKVYQKLMRLGSSYRKHLGTSEAVQISTEGVEQLEIYFGKYVPQFFYSLLAPLTLFFVVGSLDLAVAVVLLICVPLIPVAIIAVQKFAKKMLKRYWGTYTGLGDTFLEGLQGLTTLKVYQADQRYAEKMDRESEKFRQVTMRVLVMQLNSISIMDLVAYGGAAAGIILSVLAYRSGSITTAESLFIILVSAEFFLPMRRLGSFFHIAMNGNAAADKIFRMLDIAEDSYAEELAQVAPDAPALTFENVAFTYPDGNKEVLQQVSFQIKPNSFTAIAGVSGCGKSTVAGLIMGELSDYRGCITVAGCDSKSLLPKQRYRRITRIGHESYLFQGTVEENLRMGNQGATTEQLEAVLRQVDLAETIADKGGLAMVITEKAANLSGGQRQRLALARAVLHDSEVYIFDEATSNVDVESENRIMAVVRELARTKTIILISHRLANARGADQILFMENGRIAERGSHEQLLEQQGPYAALYTRQKELEQYRKERVG